MNRLRHALFLLPMLWLLVVSAVAAQSVPAIEPVNRIAAARDAVLPVVVSILTVREDFRQGTPVLSVSSGSGTVVSAQGHVATNAHVTENGKSFRLIFSDGRELPAILVGDDKLDHAFSRRMFRIASTSAKFQIL